MFFGNTRRDGLWPNDEEQTSDARSVIRAKTKQNIRQNGADARLLLKRKNTKQNTKPVDAREKLEKLQNKQKNLNQGLIPKVTIFNDDNPGPDEDPFPMKSELAQILSRKSDKNNMASTTSLDKNASGRNIQSGLRIAVTNEFAQQKKKTQVKAKPKTPPSKKKINDLAKHEQMKITMVNKDAAKRQEEMLLKQQRKNKAQAAKRPISTYDDESSEEEEEEAEYTRPIPVKLTKYDRPMMSSHSKSFAKTMAAAKAQVLSMDTMPHTSKQDPMLAPEYSSPIEGTRLMVTNLHPIVTEDDILELFSVIGAIRRARLIKPGVAEVVYINQEHALTAYNKYNDRDLDGQPMEIQLSLNETSLQSQPHYSWMSAVSSSRKHGQKDTAEIDTAVLQQALFKGGSTGTSIRPVVFTVKI